MTDAVLLREIRVRIEQPQRERAGGSVVLPVHAGVHPDHPRPGELRANADLLEQARAAHSRECLNADGSAFSMRRGIGQRSEIAKLRRASGETRTQQEAAREPLCLRAVLQREIRDHRESRNDLGGAPRARERIDMQQRLHQAIELARNLRAQRRRRRRRRHPRCEQIGDVPCGIRIPAGEHPVRERTERIQVCALIQQGEP